MLDLLYIYIYIYIYVKLLGHCICMHLVISTCILADNTVTMKVGVGVGIPLLLILLLAAVALAAVIIKLKKIKKTIQRMPSERGKGLCMFVNKIN